IHTIIITKFPVYDRQGNITKVGSVGFDLTEQVQANQAKSEFLANMSHDLRTPLNAILGFADFISNQYFGPVGDKYQEYAEDIHSSGELLLSLVNDILDLSAIEAGKRSLAKENLSITDVVTECEKFIEEKAKSLGIDLIVEVPKDLPSLYADRRAIMQILLNLLSNAVKFTPEGGKVVLRATATNEHHTIEVSDTGTGIPDDKIATITDPFVRGETDPHQTQEGTGLGLTIVKSLVDLHDGELDIKSTVGKGTTVTVTLPNGGTL
ncbi:MAG: HAMP domain-containing histidine kinase, partial [Rhodospirillales bacterium]|nr:HAMP domain-containing histidine kinase [Rhodospirillales bacterium]